MNWTISLLVIFIFTATSWHRYLSVPLRDTQVEWFCQIRVLFLSRDTKSKSSSSPRLVELLEELITRNPRPCSTTIPEHVPFILTVTRWLPLLREQHFCPRQEEREGQRVKVMYQLSLVLFIRKAIALLGATPAGLSLAGTSHLVTTGWTEPGQGSTLSGSLPLQLRPVFQWQEWRGNGSRGGAVSASVLLFLFYW